MSETTKPVMVTTEHRGVFFGYVAPEAKLDVKSIRLERARMCIYWSADVRGVLGLAVSGPTAGCRIGPPVQAITLRGVTAVTECTREAAANWEKSQWAR